MQSTCCSSWSHHLQPILSFPCLFYFFAEFHSSMATALPLRYNPDPILFLPDGWLVKTGSKDIIQRTEGQEGLASLHKGSQKVPPGKADRFFVPSPPPMRKLPTMSTHLHSSVPVVSSASQNLLLQSSTSFFPSFLGGVRKGHQFGQQSFALSLIKTHLFILSI